MTKKDEPIPHPIRDPHHVPITFGSVLIGVGHWNGVVNLTIGAAQFTPQVTTDTQADPDFVVTSRLRLDLACATQLYTALGKIIEQMSLPPANATTH